MATPGDLPIVVDPLTDALASLRVDGMFYCPSVLTHPWGIELPQMDDHLWFHIVTSGECIFVTPGGVELSVVSGDVLVFAHGGRHVAFDETHVERPSVFGLPHEYVTERYARMRHGGGGQAMTLTCGVVKIEHQSARRLTGSLPEVIRLRSEADDPWFDSLLTLIATETQDMKPGSEAVVTRLCDILVIHTIRTWISQDEAAATGWVGALRDPHIGVAVAAIHREPGRSWTVEELAKTSSMSRSAFSARFTELIGESPAQYLTRWRMELAADMLATSNTSIFEIATSLGYGSEAAFSRAYKRVMGAPPSQTRGA